MTTPTASGAIVLNPELDYLFVRPHQLGLTPTLGVSSHEAFMRLGNDDLPRIEGWGTANRTDLEGDIMQESAFADLCDLGRGYMDDESAPPVNTCFIDHHVASEYILGTLIGATPGTGIDRQGTPFASVKTSILPLPENALTYLTVQAINRGHMIGLSFGFSLNEYAILKDEDGKPAGISFERVSRRELSSCPWPAAQLAWVTGLVKGAVTRGLLPGTADLGELRYVARHWADHDGLDAVRLLRIARALERRATQVTADAFLGGRLYADLPEEEKMLLATDIRRSLSGMLS